MDTVIGWSGPRKCHWLGCVSRATFHSPSSLRAHIKNVHVSPLICRQQGCSYTKPFGKPCDLKRHLASVHHTVCKYECPESGCQETFSRKDKMLKHAREKHERYRCSCNHCTATVFATERESHLQNSHGQYECAMGSCQNGSRSYFSETGLKRHLRTIHRMTSDPVRHMVWRLSSQSANRTNTEPLYARSAMRPAYRDCTSCSVELPTD